MPADEGTTRTLAVLSLVFGILSLLVIPLLFGIGAIVVGTIAGSRRSVMGWFGMALGIVGVFLNIMNLLEVLSE